VVGFKKIGFSLDIFVDFFAWGPKNSSMGAKLYGSCRSRFLGDCDKIYMEFFWAKRHVYLITGVTIACFSNGKKCSYLLKS